MVSLTGDLAWLRAAVLAATLVSVGASALVAASLINTGPPGQPARKGGWGRGQAGPTGTPGPIGERGPRGHTGPEGPAGEADEEAVMTAVEGDTDRVRDVVMNGGPTTSGLCDGLLQSDAAPPNDLDTYAC